MLLAREWKMLHSLTYCPNIRGHLGDGQVCPLLYDVKTKTILKCCGMHRCPSYTALTIAGGMCRLAKDPKLHTQFVISFNFVSLFHQRSFGQGSNDSSFGSHFFYFK